MVSGYDRRAEPDAGRPGLQPAGGHSARDADPGTDAYAVPHASQHANGGRPALDEHAHAERNHHADPEPDSNRHADANRFRYGYAPAVSNSNGNTVIHANCYVDGDTH